MTSYRFGDVMPQVAASAFIAPGARLIGDVTIGEDSSIWYNCVLRGDVERIIIGARSNVQDGSVIHVSGARDGPGLPTVIGDDVLVGHMVMLHACRIENHGFIGLGSIVMDGCVVHEGGMLAAGALLTPGKAIGAGELWAGRPAKFLRVLTDEEVKRNRYGASGYVRLARMHKASL